MMTKVIACFIPTYWLFVIYPSFITHLALLFIMRVHILWYLGWAILRPHNYPMNSTPAMIDSIRRNFMLKALLGYIINSDELCD